MAQDGPAPGVDDLHPVEQRRGYLRFVVDGTTYLVTRERRTEVGDAWSWHPSEDPEGGGPWRRTRQQAVVDFKHWLKQRQEIGDEQDRDVAE